MPESVMRSVRIKLNLWYVAILAVLLSLFSTLLYFSVASSFARETDRTLLLRANGTADTIFAFWQAERAAAGGGPGNWAAAPSRLFERQIGRGELPGLLERWAQKTGNLGGEQPVRLLDRKGRPLKSSASFDLLKPLPDKPAVLTGHEGRIDYQTLRLPEQRLRLITRPIFSGPRLLYYVQCAASLKDMDAALGRLRTSLLVAIPLMLLLASAIGFLLASRALGPVRAIIGRVEQFTAELLHQSVAVPHNNDELGQLDATLNDMLVRMNRAFRQLRQLSAAASHELRTPLTAMKGEIEVALRRPRSPEEYRRVLQAHLETVDDMTQTVEELLRLAQTEAVEDQAKWQPMDLSALLRRIHPAFVRAARKKDVMVQLQADEPVWIVAEPRLIERLIANLLENALRFTPPQGRISLSVECRGQQAQVVVSDTGAGIAAEQMPQLFDQFFKRRPTADGSQSTGLGLGLCRWIAELHHGHILVASTPGSGATLTVLLPLAEVHAQAPLLS